MEIFWDIDSPLWDVIELETLGAHALTATVAHLGLPDAQYELSVLATSDARQAELNGAHRGKPTPTNVLSWPAQVLAPQDAGAVPTPPTADPFGEIPLGDLALAFETCQREAVDQAKTMQDHVTHLIVHGILHLLGYDHIRDPDATLMEAIETEILGKLGVDDPYYLASAV